MRIRLAVEFKNKQFLTDFSSPEPSVAGLIAEMVLRRDN
jgi:hypothetical protein